MLHEQNLLRHESAVVKNKSAVQILITDGTVVNVCLISTELLSFLCILDVLE